MMTEDGLTTRGIVERYFALARSAAPEVLAELFSETADFDIPGDGAGVPWVGRREGRAGIAAFISAIRRGTRSDIFRVDNILVEGDTAVVIGYFRTWAVATNRLMESDFAIIISVADGLIRRFRLLEDSYAVSQALRAQRETAS
jgi:ketosteroid isomerase-like protein